MALSWKLPMVIEPPAARRMRGAKMPLAAIKAVPARPALMSERRRIGRFSNFPEFLVLSSIFLSLLVALAACW